MTEIIYRGLQGYIYFHSGVDGLTDSVYVALPRNILCMSYQHIQAWQPPYKIT